MQWMVKYTLYLFIISFLGFLSSVFANTSDDELLTAQARIEEFSAFLGINKLYISEKAQNKLPPPYDFLLVQPLMTIGIGQYYQRTLKIQVIHDEVDQDNHTYSRVIQMLLEKDKTKDSDIAKSKQDGVMVVEMAYIKINFNELPQEVISSIMHTQIPLGTILTNNKINTISKDRCYFSINCNADLARLLQCKRSTIIYGRVNTLIRADNKQWIAQVLEILPGLKCKDKQCSLILEN